ncbi:MAG TPA: response regulator [Euzebyales bacterium]|nr:response regulator [Euzebyales bacterium]
MVLDVALPGPDGLAVARRLRRDGCDLPILMLTARDAVEDRVAGLDAGADDYLVKPFALQELLARLRALLRRTTDDDVTDTVTFQDLRMDPVAREVRRGDRSGRRDAAGAHRGHRSGSGCAGVPDRRRRTVRGAHAAR